MTIANSIITGKRSVIVLVKFVVAAVTLDAAPRVSPTEVATLLNIIAP